MKYLRRHVIKITAFICLSFVTFVPYGVIMFLTLAILFMIDAEEEEN